MLYVFYVDIGSMLKFDINLAAQSVLKLQEVIARQHHIPVNKQVLLVSGGENVTSSSKVSSYFTGTDSSPFFLFNKDALESHFPSFEFPASPSDKMLEEQLKEYLDRSPTLEVVAARAKIVQNFYDAAKKKLETCTELVHSQHLQNQGWGAVIANLLDITSAFKVRVNLFLQNLDEYLEEYDQNLALINGFPQVLALLNKIPLLPCLPANVTSSKETEVESLLDWINAHDVRGSLDDLIQQCKEGLHQYGHALKEEQLVELKKVEEAIFVDKKEMKVIKGLEDRLSGLEKLMVNVKKIVKEQEEMSKMFSNFHIKVRSLQDQSSVADLCGSHRQYLEITLSNHHCLLQNTYKCYKTKHELCENLNNRLRWVMLTEQSLCKTENQIMLRFETLKKLRQKLEVVQQISCTPHIFCKAIIEVFRRRDFTRNFLRYAARTSSTFNESHNKEVSRRKSFETQTKIQNHFLKSLFPGLDDLPSSYGTKCPDDFDKNLPKITSEDILFLQQKVPELAEELRLDAAIEQSLDGLQSKYSQTNFKDLVDASERENSSHKDQFPTKLSHSQEMLADIMNTESASQTSFSWDEKAPPSLAFEQVPDTTKVDVSTLTSPLTHRHLNKQGSHPSSVTPNLYATAGVASHRCTTNTDDSSGANTKVKRHQLQSTSTSPDCEDGQNELFATADFYFDESLHSSGTTDPASSKKITELQLLLQERVVQLESKEKELNESKEILQNSSTKFSSLSRNYCELVKFCSECLFETRNFLTGVKVEHGSFIQIIMNSLQENQADFGRLAKDILYILANNEETIQENQIELFDVKEKLQNASDQAESLSKVNEGLKKQLAERNCAYDGAVSGAHALKDEMEEKFNQMVLENEVEAEKIRSDFVAELRGKEDEVNNLLDQIKSVSGELKAAVYDKELCLEALTQQFEQEKGDCMVSLTSKLMGEQRERDALLRSELEEDRRKKEADLVAHIESKNRTNLQNICRELDELFSNLKSVEERIIMCEYTDSMPSNSGESLPLATISCIEGVIYHKFDIVSGTLRQICDGLDLAKQDFNNVKVKLQEAEKVKTNLEKEYSELQLKLIESLDDIKSPVTNQSLEESDTSLVKIEYQRDDKCMQTSAHEQLSPADHEKLVAEKISQTICEHQGEITQLKMQHDKYCEDLVDDLKKKHELEKGKLKEFTRSESEAERQIVFNRALNQALHDRDLQIDLLEKTLASLKDEMSKMKNESQKAGPAITSKLTQSTSDGKLCGVASKVTDLESQPTTSFDQSFVVQSTSPSSDQDFLDRINVLEVAIKTKDVENKKLREKLMQLSMTRSSQSLYQDCINIRTCNEGSITLFVWDQICNHYIAYLFNTANKYFLHSESLEAFGIRPDVSPTPWVVAEVTSKECCQAKKPSNRFRVPVGTKFYRVRAKPWNPEADLHPKNKKTKSDL